MNIEKIKSGCRVKSQKPACSNCLFGHDFSDESNPDVGWGCHRYPPDKETESMTGGFRRTCANWWCGEYRSQR